MGETRPEGAGVPWRSRTVQVVFLSTALAPLGVRLISPGLPVFRDVFGVTDARASLLISGYFLVGIVFSPFVGILADRIGRKRVLVGGLLTFGIFGGAMAFAPNFDVVLVLRVVQGVGTAAIFVTTVTIVGDVYEGPRRDAVLGVNVAALSATAAVFPVIGGVLVTLAWYAPFLTYFAAFPVAAFVFVALDETASPPADRGSSLRDSFWAVTTPGTLAAFGVRFLAEFLAFGAVYTAVPFLLAGSLSPVLVGGVLLVTETASTLVAASSGRVALTLSNEQTIAAGFACYGVGFLAAWVAPGPVAVTGALVLVGGGVGLLLPASDAAVSDRVPAAHRAGAFSLRTSTMFLGRTTGPVVFVGLAVTVGLGYDRLLLIASVVATAAFAVTLVAGAVTGD